ncbi:MAG: ribosome biogenesis GTPase YlqF [Cyanobacteria bacterium SIG30]|nr:ribosome biogenesis GTPase YlqF [Cyanobacteria bacterium SIG30]
MNIHWYPGHIAKAQKELKEKLNLVDVVLEILDARLPVSSAYTDVEKLCPKPRLILLNKVDLIEDKDIVFWTKYLEKKTNCKVVPFNSEKDTKVIVSKILELSSPIIEKMQSKGLLPRATRVMVIGLPNVGKSSVINRLIKKSKTKTGAKAGVTRQQQWVRVHPKIDLLDTPGIIPTVQNDQDVALKLAIVNSVGEKAYDSEHVARGLLNILSKNYEKNIREYYKLEENEEITLENISIKRNWITKGSLPDTLRTADFILSNFRGGKIGKIVLDEKEKE